MPNHIQNRLRFIGATDEITKVREHIKGDVPWRDSPDVFPTIDFLKIIPLPDDLYEDLRITCIRFWDTKWNAYSNPDSRDSMDTIFFTTANSAPLPVIKKLSSMFPSVEMELSYADEDAGHNTGVVRFVNGQVTENCPEPDSLAGWELYFELHPGTKDKCERVGDTYRFKE